MQDNANSVLRAPKRTPWNRGKLIGAKPPLRQKHVWAIRTKLQIEQRTRDLALFNVAIDSKLRGCDVVALKVEDVAPNGYSIARAALHQAVATALEVGVEARLSQQGRISREAAWRTHAPTSILALHS
jgi:hypothetical protein